MQVSTVSSQGQILIPKKIREKLEIEAGTKISFIPQKYTIAIIPQKDAWIKDAKGILSKEINKRDGVKKAHREFEKEWDEEK